MNHLQTHISYYLNYCQSQKRLDAKTLKAYRIDLRQFEQKIPTDDISKVSPDVLETYIAGLHQTYAPKTVKRKIASNSALLNIGYFILQHIYHDLKLFSLFI